jgi:hypothetical protein
MSTKNLFTGLTREENKAINVRILTEPIAKILARAEALNPLPHLSSVNGFFSLGAGRRSGPLCGRRTRRERVSRGDLFGIQSNKS